MGKSYTRNTWVNDAPPAINATNLNNVENGLENIVKLDQQVTITTTDNSDITLTEAQNQYGVITIDTTASTTSINVILNNDPHMFLAIVTGGQEVTFKTSAGTGITVSSGNENRKQLRNNETDIVEYLPEAGGGGKILQVVTVAKTDTFSTSSSTGVDVTGFSASITPSDVSSTIIAVLSCHASNATLNRPISFILERDGTPVGVGDASGSKTPRTLEFSTDSFNNSLSNGSLQTIFS